MSLQVIDSSVALKWVLNDEENVEEAIALRNAGLAGEFGMVAPSLWIIEIINGLATAVRRVRVSTTIGKSALTALMNSDVSLADPEPEKIYEIALAFGIASYDAAYLALAETLKVPLWTGDKKLYNKISGRFQDIKWIGNYTA